MSEIASGGGGKRRSKEENWEGEKKKPGYYRYRVGEECGLKILDVAIYKLDHSTQMNT